MRLKKTSINSIVSIISLIITVLTSLILSKYFLKYFGIEYNGLNGLFNNIVSILSITELGIAGSISYALYKPIYENDIKKISQLINFFKKSYQIIACVILGISVILSFIVPVLVKNSSFSDYYIRIVFILFSLSTIVSYFFSYNRTLLYAYQNNYFVSIVDFIFKLLKTIIQIFLMIKFQNYVLFLIFNIFITFANNYVIHIIAKIKYPEIKVSKEPIADETKNELFSTVKTLAIIQILSVSINYTDNVIISSVIGISTTGLFTNYYLIYSQLNSFISIIFNSVGASLGNLLAENNKRRIKEVMYNFEYLGFFLGSFCSICLYFLIQPFISDIWLGKEYLLPASISLIMVCNLYISINRQAIIYYLRLSGNHNYLIKPTLVESIVNIVISLSLAYLIGLNGVLVGTLVSAIISHFLSVRHYNRFVEQRPSKYWLRQLLFLGVTLIEGSVIYIISGIVKITNPIISFLFTGIICVVITWLVILFVILKNKKLDIFIRILKRVKIYKAND